ncbi:alpha-(1-_3)-arabinofuranosyltransferase domain-containing protein [Aquihabitans sp. McL0605]|uniref:alpha-(1->3)-arabinofuranosyltransferase domain-containing protein n=1 Tax=Aquihabitans sp. McL0605 TaxID=3415671 RepID=UPI003CE7BAB8
MTASPLRRVAAMPAWLDAVVLGVVAYLPFLLSSPGRVSSDSKQALYVHPGQFVRDAAYLWDPSVAAGTVPHQHIGYLWPMGPWFWAFDTLGVPVWVAQRLWLGTLTFAAAMGVRWLIRSMGMARTTALAAALVYALTPYQLAFTARTSVLLLPWAGLPWLVELTRRAVRRGGWRHPAAFALVTFTVAGVNAPSLILVGLAPLAVLVETALIRPERRRAALGAGLRIAAFSVPVSAWWLAGLKLQGTYGIPVLQLTESLRTVAEKSTPDDVLRGLGNWFFYGSDRGGSSVDQASYYVDKPVAAWLSYLVPMVALATAAVVRWRHRILAVLMVLSAVVAVGAWPYDDPSPFGRLFKAFADGTSAGLAFRNSPRVVPVLVLGMALLLAAAITALPERGRLWGAALVALIACAGLTPVVKTGMLSSSVDRPEDLPQYWLDAAKHLDAAGSSTRVLELPGANFAAYRWGNAIEPITPLLINRPYLAREVLPYGSPQSALMLDALDRRLQNGVLDPASVAPVARLLGVGDVVLRNDLEYERFGIPSPDTVWGELAEPRASGLGAPVTFGTPTANVGDQRYDPLTPADLHSSSTLDRTTPLAPVAVLPVEDAQAIVRTASVQQSIVMAGDADGIVDAAAAGILDGRSLVLLSAGLTDQQVRRAAAADGHLVLTDSNRRRIQTWFNSLKETRGPTEQAGETMVEPSGYDARLDAFPGSTDDERTVVEQLGGTTHATSSGGAARPAERPAAAFDGRLSTSWRIGGPDPRGQQITVAPEKPQAVDHITVVQPQDGPRDRVLTRIRLHFDDGTTSDVALGPESLEPTGQVISFPKRTIKRLGLEILGTSDPGFDPALANAVGFAEVKVGDLRIEETVRLPLDLLHDLGRASDARSLDVLLTRLRTDPSDWQLPDDEARLDRTFVLPSSRSFGIVGTARPAEGAGDPAIDQLLGTDGTATFSSSSRLQGAPDARASRAFDRDPKSAWTTAFGGIEKPWIQVQAADPVTFDEVTMGIVADGHHSLPSTIAVEVDGKVVAHRKLGPIAEGTDPGHVTTVKIPLGDAVARGRKVRFVIEDQDERSTPKDAPGSSALPISITDIRGGTLPIAAKAGSVDRACRDDLVSVDGRPLAARLSSRAADGTMAIDACDPVTLHAGSNRVLTTLGERTGVDVDVLRLMSAPGGAPAAAAVRGGAASTARIVKDPVVHRTSVSATVAPDGDPFWFVLGQSYDAGWKIDVEGGTAGPRTLVDGYANGWAITPDGSGPVTVHLTWTPQRTVWIAMALSLLTIVLAGAILIFTPGDEHHVGHPAAQLLRQRKAVSPSTRLVLISGAVTFAAVLLISRPWIAVVAAVASMVIARWPVATWAAAVLAPVTLAIAHGQHRPELGWLALAWVLAAVVADELQLRTRARPRP